MSCCGVALAQAPLARAFLISTEATLRGQMRLRHLPMRLISHVLRGLFLSPSYVFSQVKEVRRERGITSVAKSASNYMQSAYNATTRFSWGRNTMQPSSPEKPSPVFRAALPLRYMGMGVYLAWIYSVQFGSTRPPRLSRASPLSRSFYCRMSLTHSC